MLLTRTGQIQVSQSFPTGRISNPEPSNNYKTHFHQPLTTIQVNKTNHMVQVPSTIGIESNRTNWTQNFPRSESSNLSNKNFEHSSTAKRNIFNARPQQSTANSSNNTKLSPFFSGSKQPMRNSTANRCRTNCPLNQQDHYIGKCPQFLSLDASRRNSEAKKNLLCFNCLSASQAAENCTSKVLCRHCNGKNGANLDSHPEINLKKLFIQKRKNYLLKLKYSFLIG